MARHKEKTKKLDISELKPLAQNPFESLGRQMGLQTRTKAKIEPGPAAPKQPMLLVRIEKRKNGKMVTCIYHLQSDQKILLKKLKQKLATGGTASEDGLELQGDHRQKIVALLEGEGFKVRLGN